MADVKNTISIFKNEDKKSEKSPDYSGNLEVNGTKFRVALWVKQAKNGKAYLGGMVNVDDKAAPTTNNTVKKETVSDLPF
jgi:uncharacterized protein (DUF736 family)